MHQQSFALSRARKIAQTSILPASSFACFKVLSDLSFTRVLESSPVVLTTPALPLYLFSSLPACLVAGAFIFIARRNAQINHALIRLVCALVLFLANLSTLGASTEAAPAPPSILLIGAACGAASVGGKIACLVSISELEPRNSLVRLSLGMAWGTAMSMVISLFPSPGASITLCAIGIVAAALDPHSRRERTASRHDIPDGGENSPVDLAGPLIAFVTCEFIFCLIGSAWCSDTIQPIRDTSLLRGTFSLVSLLALVAIGVFSTELPNIYTAFRIACLPLAAVLMVIPLVGDTAFVLVRAILSSLVSLIATIALHHIAGHVHSSIAASIKEAGILYLTSEAGSCLALMLGTVLSAYSHALSIYGAIGLSVVTLIAALCGMASAGRRRFEAVVGDEVEAIKQALAQQLIIETDRTVQQPLGQAETIRRETRMRLIAQRYGLSQREAQVVGHYALGKSAERIAENLGLKTSTVRSYLKKIFIKMSIHSKQELIELYEQIR